MIEFVVDSGSVLERVRQGRGDSYRAVQLRRAAEKLSLVQGFEELVCLPSLRGVERYPHQERTALHVMRRLRGRAILGDEVGLGKTIEACLCIKEYLMRGLVKRVLVLCAPSLVSQWRSELADKFDLRFRTTQDDDFKEAGWAGSSLLIASLPLARRAAHRQAIVDAGGFDLTVVDESHVLRKRTSSAWKLIGEIPKKYLLLLTATPVQNELEELYNLITLLRPGQLGTPAEFRRNFVDSKDARRPRNVQKLRELMLDVMVRNTRSQVQVVLPPRRARTLRLQPDAAEKQLLDQVHSRIHQAHVAGTLARRSALTLQAEAGSSPAALAATLERCGWSDLADQARRLGLGAKAPAVLEAVRRTGEPMLLFSRFRATLDALQELFVAQNVPVFLFHGGLTATERDEQLAQFSAAGRGVLLLSEVGSEGKNLQFCRHLINYDLPWNPMKIEQRVGRVHRIGQTRPIEILNLCLSGTLEDHLLRILDEKLNMFELVVGELELILGPLEEEGDLEDVLAELCLQAPARDDLAEAMQALEEQLLHAREQSRQAQQLDEEIFGREFEVDDAAA